MNALHLKYEANLWQVISDGVSAGAPKARGGAGSSAGSATRTARSLLARIGSRKRLIVRPIRRRHNTTHRFHRVYIPEAKCSWPRAPHSLSAGSPPRKPKARRRNASLLKRIHRLRPHIYLRSRPEQEGAEGAEGA